MYIIYATKEHTHTHNSHIFILSTPRFIDTGKFELEGASYPGIVYNVTSVLTKHGLNIDTMGTVEEIAPHGGTHLFRMRGIAHLYKPVPKSFDPNKVREELREVGDSLNCEVTLEDVAEIRIVVPFMVTKTSNI